MRFVLDCDSNDDCYGPGLLCLQRIANEPVPGCAGDPVFSVDYCIKVEDYVEDDVYDFYGILDMLEADVGK